MGCILISENILLLLKRRALDGMYSPHPSFRFHFKFPRNLNFNICSHFVIKYDNGSGPDSSVDIAIDYGLDGPGIESRWGRDFPHLSRPVLGPTHPPVQWVPPLSWG